MELIPLASVSVLPLAPEPLAAWTPEGDLHDLLTKLFDVEGVMIDPSGQERVVNYSSYGHSRYDDGLRDFTTWSQEFRDRAMKAVPAPASKIQSPENIPDFRTDANFGLMAKYQISWSAALNAILSEDGFFSIAHTLESEDDAECSVVLASHLYYRQAGQVLRNVIEGVFAHMYFCEDDEAFAQWRSGIFKMPPLRGRDGLLKRLAARSLLTQELATEADSVYGQLCSDVHGAENRLVNRGIFTGEWVGRLFEYDRFAEWCGVFARTIDLSIRVQRLTTNRWLQVLPQGMPFCSMCHNDKRWEREAEEFAGRRYLRLKCLDCGSTMALDASRVRDQFDPS